MTDQRQQAAIAGAANRPLTRNQKKRVCVVAGAAWDKQGRPHFDPKADPDIRLTKTEAMELWRHEEQDNLIGRRHLTTATQADFPLLMAHFYALAGWQSSADYWSSRIGGDDGRRAAAALNYEYKTVRDVIARPREYIATIATSKFGTANLRDLAPADIWTLVFDLRRAAAARRRKRGGA